MPRRPPARPRWPRRLPPPPRRQHALTRPPRSQTLWPHTRQQHDVDGAGHRVACVDRRRVPHQRDHPTAERWADHRRQLKSAAAPRRRVGNVAAGTNSATSAVLAGSAKAVAPPITNRQTKKSGSAPAVAESSVSATAQPPSTASASSVMRLRLSRSIELPSGQREQHDGQNQRQTDEAERQRRVRAYVQSPSRAPP